MKTSTLFGTILVIALFCSTLNLQAQRRERKQRSNTTTELNTGYAVDTLPFEEELEERLLKYQYNTRAEKLFLHIDKESCLLGDTLWFRGYLNSATTNTAADYSRFIYVELTDRDNVVYWREKVGRVGSDSLFIGFFPIPDDITQGEYFIRAFTYYQQNFDEEYLFKKRIRIINPYDHKIECKIVASDKKGSTRNFKVSFVNNLNERYNNISFNYIIPGETPNDSLMEAQTGYNGQTTISVKDPMSDHIWIRFTNDMSWEFEKYIPLPGVKRSFDLSFYPEGGARIENVEQKIGFKATGRDGLGVHITGTVFNKDNQPITNFESNIMGIGCFIDNCGEYVIVKNDDGMERQFMLPKHTAKSEDRAVTLICDKSRVTYNILGANNSADHDKYMLIHSRGVPLAIFKATDMINKPLNLDNSPTGIIHFVLLDKNGHIYSDRLWFHDKQPTTNIDIIPQKKFPSPREDENVILTIKNLNKEKFDTDSLNGSFSVSVVNNGQTVINNNEGGIKEFLLLTSDLKGFIENPAFYLSDTSEKGIANLDNLMLTQGWSRFNIETAVKGQLPDVNQFYMERGQFLSGMVKNLWGKPVNNANIILIGTNGIARKLTTDSVGYFLEEDIWYDEGTRFIAQALTEKGKSRIELQLNNPEFSTPKATIPMAAYITQNDNGFYNSYAKDYIFSESGERITTLGGVKVNGFATRRSEIIKKYIEENSRLNFLLGINTVTTFGETPGYRGVKAAKAPNVPASMRYYDDLREWVERSRYPDPFGSTPYTDYDDITSLPNISEDLADEWNSIATQENKNYSHNAQTLVYKSNRNIQHRMLGITPNYKYTPKRGEQFQNAEDFGGIIFEPLYDNLVIQSIEVQWNMQTVVPFAQQQYAEFYKPSYDVRTELLKQPIDEKITRYWNPNVKLFNSEPYTITFPTADGAGNHSYTIVINGMTSNGEAIYKSMIIKE